MPQPNRLNTKGLATVALLKALYDSGRSHRDLFLPIVLDTVHSMPEQAFSARQCCETFRNRYGLSVPEQAMRSLLRSLRPGLRQEQGLFLKGDLQPADPSIGQRRISAEREQLALGTAFQTFAASHGRELDGGEEALNLILLFLEETQLAFLLGDPERFNLQPTPSLPDRDWKLVAAFLRGLVEAAGPHAETLKRLLEGFVLQNALQFTDIEPVRQVLRDLDVSLDTRFLIDACGLAPEPAVASARETLQLIQSAGARTSTFEVTVDEMRRVLAAYEEKIGTTEGILTLRPSSLTDYCLKTRVTPSDLRQAASLLKKTLEGLQVQLRPMPAHHNETTYDEAALAEAIRNKRTDEDVQSPRVQHDVDCVAGILTRRAGLWSDSLASTEFIFATPTLPLVHSVRQWYAEAGGKGQSPVASIFAVSALAAAHNPVTGCQLKLHQLVALCSAILRPSEQIWSAFLGHLEKCRRSGELTSEEAVSLVVEGLIQQELVNSELEGRGGDAANIPEMVDRVKQESESRGFARAESLYEPEIRRERERADRAELSATDESARTAALASRQRSRLHLVADVFAWILFGPVYVLVLCGLCRGLLPTGADSALWRHCGWAAAAVAGVVGVVLAIRGGAVRSWRETLRELLLKRLASWFGLS